jgi:hypothetical protein
MPRSKAEKREKETTWNLKKVGGWEAYKMKTDELANRIEEIVDDHDKPIDEVMENVMKVENKIKFAAFGKTRKQVGFKKTKVANNNQSKCNQKNHTCKTTEEINVCILRRQSERMEKEILEVKQNQTGRVGKVFKMKAKVTGNKKSGTEPHAIIDPNSGDLLVTNKEIRDATLAYCVDNLRNRKPDPEVENLVNIKMMINE